MPQQLLVPRDNNGNSPDRATVYKRTGSRPSAAGSASVTAYPDDLGDAGSAACSHPFVEDRMTLAFQHLDVVLAIAARGAGEGGCADGNASLNARCLHADSAPQVENGVCQRITGVSDSFDAARSAPAAGNPEDQAPVRRACGYRAHGRPSYRDLLRCAAPCHHYADARPAIGNAEG